MAVTGQAYKEKRTETNKTYQQKKKRETNGRNQHSQHARQHVMYFKLTWTAVMFRCNCFSVRNRNQRIQRTLIGMLVPFVGHGCSHVAICNDDVS